MFEVLAETLIDSLKMLPFLLIAYLLIEYIEHRTNNGMGKILAGTGKYGPAGAAILGAFPQCGFSVAAANFYAGRIITRGTLVAVFLSTSDEAIPVMLSTSGSAAAILPLIGVKIIIGMVAGFFIDWLDRLRSCRGTAQHGQEVTLQRHSNNHNNHSHNDLCGHCHCGEGIFKAALRHTVKVFFFIALVMLALNSLFYLLGEEVLEDILMMGSFLQPLLAGLIGFIPNCAGSVVLAELYLSGAISFGSVVAGLSTGSGVGIAVLFQANKNMKENLRIAGTLYLVGVGSGLILNIIFNVWQ